MTSVITRIPITLSLAIADSIETPAGRLVQIHGLLRNGLEGLKVEAKTPAGNAVLEISEIDQAKLAATWDNDPIDGETATWNTLGQRVDTREYKVEPQNDSEDTSYVLYVSARDQNWKAAAIIPHPVVAEAFGEAYLRGEVNFAPAYDFA